MSKETKKNSLLEKNADFEDFDWSRVPDDVESAILLLRQRFPPLIFARQSKLKPVLVSQLYSILDNKTLVDTRLSELIEERKLRKIRLLKHTADYCVVDATEYGGAVRAHVESFVKSKSTLGKRRRDDIDRRWNADTERSQTKQHVLDTLVLFASNITQESSGEPSVSDTQLRALLAKHLRGALSESDVPFAQTDVSSAVNVLVEAGVVLPDTAAGAASRYFWCLPGMGQFLSQLLKGRKEILKRIGKSKFKELLLSDLQNLKTTTIPATFLLADLKGNQSIREVSSTAGKLYRLA